MIKVLKNIASDPIKGFQVNVVAVSYHGYEHGFSESFKGLIDTGARHTCVSDKIMRNILDEVLDENGNKLISIRKVKVAGVYGVIYEEPVYIVPHFYIGSLHLTNVEILALRESNIDCLIGRSILSRCILELNSELNEMTFDFRDNLNMPSLKEFDKVYQYTLDSDR